VESIAKKAQEPGACLIFGPAALPDGDWMAVLTYPTGLAFAIWKPRAWVPQTLKRVNATALMKTAWRFKGMPLRSNQNNCSG